MSRAAIGEAVVSAESEDGFRLDGLLVEPTRGMQGTAVLVVPGLYAAYHDPPYPDLARALARRGHPTLVGNTRGHDFGAVLRRADGSIVPGGGGWEELAECPRDVGGWLGFLEARSFGRVVLLGHSLGARKAAYSLAVAPDRRVVGLAVASGFAGPAASPDPEILCLARKLTAEGRGRDLLPWPAVGCSMSARTYLDHEDPDSPFLSVFRSNGPRYLEPFVARVAVPILALFGAEECGPDGNDRSAELETIRRGATASPSVEKLIIPDLGHLYVGRERAVADAVVNWQRKVAGTRRGRSNDGSA